MDLEESLRAKIDFTNQVFGEGLLHSLVTWKTQHNGSGMTAPACLLWIVFGLSVRTLPMSHFPPLPERVRAQPSPDSAEGTGDPVSVKHPAQYRLLCVGNWETFMV